jgi:rubrerythrin
MATEQDKTLAALKKAIQMEIDGKTFYLKASQASSNELGRKLLNSLANEEDLHRKTFEEIYQTISAEKDWPATGFQPDGGRGLRTIFARALEEMDSNIKAASTELDAVRTAMDMENETLDYYKEQSRKAAYDSERDFYEALAAQESEHHLILLDYYEFLKDPAAWFVQKEHPSLDGG